MSRYHILKGIPSPSGFLIPNVRNQCVYLEKENLTLVLIPSEVANENTAWITQKLTEICEKPYAVFVSDTIDMKLLVQTFENTKDNYSFSLARRSVTNPNMISTNERRWTTQEMGLLDGLNFNFLKFLNPYGFLIWSDNIIGPVWNESIADPLAHSLSMYRKLNFIDEGFTYQERTQRALSLGCGCRQTGSNDLVVHFNGIAYSFVFITGEYVYAENACNYASKNAGVT